jgi:hypothetical protein
MVAVWFALGHEGPDNRRWWAPMLVVGLVPIMVGCAINWVKFGQLFGFKLSNQLAFLYLPRSGKDFSISYVPATVWAYFQPLGLKLVDVFPFFMMPQEIPANPGIVTDPTASLPSSMPLLFLLGSWGLVCAIRPRQTAQVWSIRLLLVAAIVAAGPLLIFGWIIERYLADFLPLMILASAVGLAYVWRDLEQRERRTKALVLASLFVLGTFSIAANFGIALTPNETWSTVQARNYVDFEKSVSDVTGDPLGAYVQRGDQRPLSWAPRDQLFVVGDCSALYISNGLGKKGSPTEGYNWLLVERAPNRSLCSQVARDG